MFFSFIVKGQNSSYLKEKDTLFIFYENSLIESNLMDLNYKNTSLNKKPTGLIIEYNLSTPSEKLKKEEYLKKSRENRDKINANDLSGYDLSLYRYGIENTGLKFVHSSKKQDYQAYENDNKYLNSLKNAFTDKKGNTDSLKIDRLLYDRYRALEKATTSLILDEEAKSKKNIFMFDGSETHKEELIKSIKEPIYIFILDKIITKR